MDQRQKVATLVFGGSDVAIPLIAEPGSAGELVYKLHIPSIKERFSLKYVELDGLLAVADSRGLTFTGYAPNARIHVAGEPLEAPPPELLSYSQLFAGPVQPLPEILDPRPTSERRVYTYNPDSVVQQAAYFEERLRSFKRQFEADPEPHFKLMELRGNPRPGVADSEGGVSMYFYKLKDVLEEVLVQQGYLEFAYVPLARNGLLYRLAQANAAQAEQLSATDAQTAAAMAAVAAAAAIAPEAAAAGDDGAGAVAERGDTSRRCSSGDGVSRREKPDLVLARIPGPTPPQQPSSSSSGVPSLQHLEREIVAFGELKVRETLTDYGAPVDLAGLFRQGEDRARAVIGQAFTYMSLLQVRYGFISCYDVLWLLERREEQPQLLYISAPIKATDAPPKPTLMLAMCWLQYAAINEPRFVLPPQPPVSSGGPGPGGSGAGPGDGSGGRPGSERRDSPEGTTRALDKRPSIPPRRDDYVSGSQYSDTDRPSDQLLGDPGGEVLRWAAHYQLPGLPALPLVPLGCLVQPTCDIVGSGATCIVLQGKFQGKGCAVKLLLLEDARCWVREVGAYQHLQVLQGVCLPKLLGGGLTCQGACCFLALELVQGLPLSLARGASEAVAAASVAALQQVHDLGYVHGDVRLENVMQRGAASGTCGAVLVDLGQARPASFQEREMEMASLRQLLDLAR